MNNRRAISLTLAAISTLAYSGKAQEQSKRERPNLLYIFPDEYRLYALSLWSDPAYRNVLSTMGDPVYTPNIDKLAKQGAIFTQVASTYPVSSPHRAMLLSGMYPVQNGVDNNCFIGRPQGLKEEIVCFTDVLQDAGYQTAYIGKTHWHKNEALFDAQGTFVGTTKYPGGSNVGEYDTYIPLGRSRHSNQYWYQHLKDDHFHPLAYSNRPELIAGKRDGEQQKTSRFSASTEADIVIRYIVNCHGERDADKPFSLFWSINPPHPPYNKIADCDSTIFNKYYRNMPLDKLFTRGNVDLSGADAKKIELIARVYFSLIKSVDDEIGRVLDTLEKSGQADNTLIVFTSDHGEMLGSKGLTGKNQIYEESFLVPFIITYPGAVAPQINDLMMGSVDIMPTILGMMGLADQIPQSVVGRDYSDGITRGKYLKNPKPTSALYLNPKMKGVRTANYTYLVKRDGTYELYDLVNDPYQTKSISLEQLPKETPSELKTALGSWLKEAQDEWYNSRINPKLINY